jgi:ketosteroid isomerase-like protein
MRKYILLTFVLTILSSCENHTNRNTNESRPSGTVGDLLHEYNQQIIKAAKTKSFDELSDLYDNESFLMAEYNPLIQAKNNIKIYYDTIFIRENIKEYTRQTVDIVTFTDKIIEIGLFTKILENSEKFRGKYFNVWKLNNEGQLKLRAESFGYLHPVENPSTLLVPEASKSKPEAINIPLELDAYNALNETNVIDRIPERSANVYTDDAMYLPFADTIKTGKSDLLKHYTAYYQNPAKIDSIQVVTYAYDEVENGYIRYAGFYVDWSVPGFSGNTTGTGISFWRREKDNTLRMHRQIGLHIHK